MASPIQESSYVYVLFSFWYFSLITLGNAGTCPFSSPVFKSHLSNLSVLLVLAVIAFACLAVSSTQCIKVSRLAKIILHIFFTVGSKPSASAMASSFFSFTSAAASSNFSSISLPFFSSFSITSP